MVAVGEQVGHYVVEGEIARGERSVAYEALDTRLGRRVVVKTVPPELADNAALRERFERQARLLASLNHPNLVRVHGLETVSGQHFLVLERVEGRTLADRLDQGRLSLRETLRIAVGIAAGLEAAHGQGIVHRNLQPSNVRLTSDGLAKVVDFDFAASAAGDEGRANDALAASTDRSAVVHYSSPELIHDRTVDQRTDIWSLGAILFECLTGRRAFAGDPMAALAAIDRQEPSWEVLPYKTPDALRRLLERCLAKDAAERPSGVRELRRTLEQLQDELDESTVPGHLTGEMTIHVPARRRSPVATVLLAALPLLTFVAGMVAGRFTCSTYFPFWGKALSGPVVADLVLKEGDWRATNNHPMAALSPDGRRLAFRGSGLFVRDFADGDERKVWESAGIPFFAPDGALGAYAASEVWTMGPDGGQPRQVATMDGTVVGAGWIDDTTIVVGAGFSSGLFQVKTDGEAPQALTTPNRSEGEVSHRWPFVLPGGRAVLFSIKDRDLVSFSDAKIGAVDLGTGEVRVVHEGGMSPRYLQGHLVYLRRGNLLAVPFDADRLEVQGAPRQLVEGVAFDDRTGHAYFGFSRSGTLFYLPGEEQAHLVRLVQVDREGRQAPLSENIVERSYSNVVGSPDGRRFAITVFAANNSIWLYDRDRDVLEMLVFGHGNNSSPVFSPDGETIAFNSDRGGQYAIYTQPVDGSAEPELLYRESGNLAPEAWGPGVLVFARTDETRGRLYAIPPDGSGEARPFLEGRFGVSSVTFSPDGRAVAFVSDETGNPEVYVMPHRDPGRRIRVSTEGGIRPLWSPDSRELFFHASGSVLAVPVTTTPDLAVGTSRTLPIRQAVYADDGERFLSTRNVGTQEGAPRLRVVFNWSSTLKD